MRIPTFGSNPKLTAVMPSFSGGLNVRAASGQVKDTELCESDNLYWEDGQLRTRDGWVAGSSRRYDANPDSTYSRFYARRDYLWQLERSVSVVNYAIVTEFTLYRFEADGKKRKAMLTRRVEGSDGGCLCIPSGGDRREFVWLVYFSDGTVFGVGEYGSAKDLTAQIYRPLCRINGTPSADRNAPLSGVAVEGRNRLTARFRCAYTADGKGLYYRLPDDTVSVVSATANGVEYPLGTAVGGYTLKASGAVCWFEKSGAAAPFPATAHNGLIVCADGPAAAITVWGMQFGTWYGGMGNAPDGTRLFLSGNSTARDTVIYSAAADPLYFPVDNYIQVGSPLWAVTAFGRQHGDLVVFKENEIYAATYVQGASVSVEAVQSGLITDLHGAMAAFPMTLISADTGCDLPDTVAVYDGSLTWGCRDGTVYALGNPSANTTYRLKRINDAVVPLFGEEVTRAAATVCRGRYWLLWDNTLWLYGDGAWYRWSWPKNGTDAYAVFAVQNELRVLGARIDRVDYVGRWYWFYQYGTRDRDETNADTVTTPQSMPVIGRLRTKSFDFGTPETYKAVNEVAAEVQSDGAVTVGYVTEKGTYTDRPAKSDKGGLLRLTPNLSYLRRLALEMQGERLQIGAVTVAVKGGMK